MYRLNYTYIAQIVIFLLGLCYCCCGLEIKKRPAIEERGESREKTEEGCTLADGS